MEFFHNNLYVIFFVKHDNPQKKFAFEHTWLHFYNHTPWRHQQWLCYSPITLCPKQLFPHPLVSHWSVGWFLKGDIILGGFNTSFWIKLGDTLKVYAITQLSTEGSCWLEFFKLKTKLLCFFSEIKTWKRWISSLLNVEEREMELFCIAVSFQAWTISATAIRSNRGQLQHHWEATAMEMAAEFGGWRFIMECTNYLWLSSFICDKNDSLSSVKKNQQALFSPQKSYDKYFLGQSYTSDLSCVTQTMWLLH